MGNGDNAALANVFLKHGIVAKVDSGCLDKFLIANWENLEPRKHTRRGSRRKAS